MNDIEISKALALAIGWKPHQLIQDDDLLMVCAEVATLKTPARWRWFDYRDPGVIWPIAERYSLFPSGLSKGDYAAAKKLGRPINDGWECLRWHYEVTGGCTRGWVRYTADTAAKAVAMAVIGRKA